VLIINVHIGRFFMCNGIEHFYLELGYTTDPDVRQCYLPGHGRPNLAVAADLSLYYYSTQLIT
jgi:hypothetical protein